MMPRPLVLLIYNLLYPLVLAVMLPRAIQKMRRRGGHWTDLGQRLGWLTAAQRERVEQLRQRGEIWWIHAVSVGEVNIARKLIQELRRRRSDLGVVLSTTTPTGFVLAREFADARPESLLALYNPLDGWFTVRRFIKRVRPSKIVLVEAEIWPNLLYAALRRHIPIGIVNARLSPRSERRFRSASPIARPLFEMLGHVLTQEQEDVERWASVGVARERIAHTGSIKYDMQGYSEPTAVVAAFRGLLEKIECPASRPVLLAASTHDGEEIALAKVYQELVGQHPDLFLVLVPRHAERAMALCPQLRELGLRVMRRTEFREDEMVSCPNAQVLVVDTTGELRAWQYLATFVIIGKSFLAEGGQNPAEALMAGKPVLFGPHMENFAALVRMLLAKDGACQVADFTELTSRLADLLQHPAKAAELPKAGKNVLAVHYGATVRTVEALTAQRA